MTGRQKAVVYYKLAMIVRSEYCLPTGRKDVLQRTLHCDWLASKILHHYTSVGQPCISVT